MTYAVILSPKARDQLIALDAYIADAASPDIAARYTDAVADFCSSLSTFPQRGTRRDDIRLGLRITNYHKRTVIAFAVDTQSQQVSILGIFHGRQDYEAVLRDAPGE
ncbi:type II toxin-antitoxin system RelE/ParE family toxin [Xanthomonas albilineans]|uniref:Probable plasmid stabilization system protein n=1 Tax=Xanthomonas albilineans (strain GPE PC73 / CFBP 7063) TaxID=380358 RepID=D6CKA9_XANAP|nr:type II toxin-antitoxin system RelE/ParE family toxin [Xanthomonas albilineans]CAZ15898.1 probable plasmid stabilization system protein [Xanthomonas albilineans]